MGLSKDISTGYMDGYMSDTPEEGEYVDPANTQAEGSDDPEGAQYPNTDQAQSQKYIPRKEKENFQVPGPFMESQRLQEEKDLNHSMYNSGVNFAHRKRQTDGMELGREEQPQADMYADTLDAVRNKFDDQKVLSRR